MILSKTIAKQKIKLKYSFLNFIWVRVSEANKEKNLFWENFFLLIDKFLDFVHVKESITVLRTRATARILAITEAMPVVRLLKQHCVGAFRIACRRKRTHARSLSRKVVTERRDALHTRHALPVVFRAARVHVARVSVVFAVRGVV